ncbi:MAG: type II toxin-antitoxin system death-on-curing family toxin [Candidatus Acidiferrales bacterium]
MTKPRRPRRPVWIDERDALAIHHRVLALEGGPAGVRDHALLQSALARPRQLHAYGDNPDIVDLAASYAIGIIRNHPFLDGNKRTGFVISVLFLEINGCHFNATEEAAAQIVLSLAAGTISDIAFTAWVRANVKQR